MKTVNKSYTYTLSGYYVCDDCFKKVQNYQERHGRNNINNKKRKK